MPGYFLPRKSSAHRIACIALYRALLKQCPRIPLPADLPPRGPINPIKHFIRKQFKQNANFTSPRIVVNALKKGYAAGQLLQSAGDGSPIALRQLHALLQTHHAQALHAAAVTPKPPPRVRVPRPEAYPGAPRVLDVRPLPKEKLSGRRRVPILAFTDTGKIPFLRFRKPQSPFLSRVLRQKVEKKVKRRLLLDSLREDIAMGWTECEWEALVCEELEREGKEWDDADWGTDPTAWVTSAQECLQGNIDLMSEDTDRARVHYKRMVDIVGKERQLDERERKERRHVKREAKWVVKKERWAREAAELKNKQAKTAEDG